MRENAPDRARRLWDGDPHKTAVKLLEELAAETKEQHLPGAVVQLDLLKTVLEDWVADRVQHVKRADAQRAEEELFRRGSQTSTDSHGPYVSRRKSKGPGTRVDMTGPMVSTKDLALVMLNCWVAVPGLAGGGKLYGDLTVEDWKRRGDDFRKKISGLGVSLSRIDWAIATIKAHEGATCLRDIPAEELVKSLPKAKQPSEV